MSCLRVSHSEFSGLGAFIRIWTPARVLLITNLALELYGFQKDYATVYDLLKAADSWSYRRFHADLDIWPTSIGVSIRLFLCCTGTIEQTSLVAKAYPASPLLPCEQLKLAAGASRFHH